MGCERSRCWDCAWRRITGPGYDPTLSCGHASDSVCKQYCGSSTAETCKEYIEDDPKVRVSIIRDTRETFMRTVHQMAVNSGNFTEAKAILHYFQPYTLRASEKITCNDFEFTTKVDFGSNEGICLSCFAAGRITEDGKDGLWNLRIYKTLDISLNAMQIFGKLGGSLTYFANQYLLENPMRFLTDREVRVSTIREKHKEANHERTADKHRHSPGIDQ